nr:MAG TPA: hypothetical protein [Caudoviricetes sp.]
MFLCSYLYCDYSITYSALYNKWHITQTLAH